MTEQPNHQDFDAREQKITTTKLPDYSPEPSDEFEELVMDDSGHDEEKETEMLLAELNAISCPEGENDVETEGEATLPEVDRDMPRSTAPDSAIKTPEASSLAIPETEHASPSKVVPLVPLSTTAPNVTKAANTMITMPSKEPAVSIPQGFALCDDGIYEMPVDDNADPVLVSSPLRVEAIFSDQHGRGMGKLISIVNCDGRWIEIPILNSELLRRPTEVIATLVDHGFNLASDRKSKDRLLGLLRAWTPNQRLLTVHQMGWINDEYKAFTFGNTPIGRSDVLPIAPASGLGTGLVAKDSADDWKVKVGSLCKDNPMMILAVSLAFSGPLLAPLEIGGGGLHFRGASSSGKTTLLRLAASVWGGRQLITQWRATSNGLEAIAGTLNDMLLPLDEIAEIPARTLHEAIYMLANGIGKARMTKDVVLADQARWRLALISSGEISVEEKLREAHLERMAGHEVRLIDIEADSRIHGVFDNLHGANSAAEFADKVRTAVCEHHGAAGQAFVEGLIASNSGDFRHLSVLVSSLADKWCSELPSAPDGQIVRVATRFALIGQAGTLATEMGLTGWSTTAAHDAAKDAFFAWYEHRYDAKREALDGFVQPLQNYLAANLNALADASAPQSGGDAQVGWRDANYAYLPKQTWMKIFPGLDTTAAAKALIEMQLLKSGEGNRTMCKAPRCLNLPGRPRLYKVHIDRVTAYKPD